MRNITFGKLLSGLFFCCLAVIAVYFLLQIFIMTKPSYIYETAITYSYTDSISVDGYVLFEETFIEGNGSIGYLVEDGNRVSKGQAVAEYYTNDAQEELRIELNRINEEIALLENSENTTGVLIENLVSQRSTAIYSLLKQLNQNSFADVQENENSFLLAQNKLQIVTGTQTDFSERIESLTLQAQSITETLGTLEEITSPVNGYFVSKNAAEYLSYSMEDLLAQSVEEFADALTEDHSLSSDNFVGKVVSSYTWHFVGVCSEEESSRFIVGDTLELAFPDKTDTVFPARVISVEVEEETGLARIVLSCEYIGADALSLGQESAEIIFKTYEGLRIPTQAIRMQSQTTEETGEDYVKGIYVAYNGLAKFRRIEILYETDGYTLVPLEGESSISEVRLYDQVIISSADLSDGKLL